MDLLLADSHDGSGVLGVGETGGVASLGLENVVGVASALVVLEDSDLTVVGGGNVDGVESLGLVALLGGTGLDGDGLDSGTVAVVGVGENVELEGVLGVDLVAQQSLLNDSGLGEQGEENNDESGESGELVHFGYGTSVGGGKKGSSFFWRRPKSDPKTIYTLLFME